MSDPIFTRTSTRVFTGEPVTDEEVEKIIAAGMQAANAMNNQPWEFYVVRNKELKPKLANFPQNAAVCEGADVVIVPCYRNAAENPMTLPYRNIDLASCCQNMLVEIEELGLGAVWQGVSPNEQRIAQVKETLGIGDDLTPFALIPVGHKGETKEQVSRYDASRVHTI